MGPKDLETLAAGKTFCFLPWSGVTTRANGDVYPCCSFNDGCAAPLGSLRESTLDEIWNSQRWRELRLAMLEGREVPQCNRCHTLEASGNQSERMDSYRFSGCLSQAVNETRPDGGVDPFSPLVLDLRFSNRCNYRCRTCSPEWSSSWGTDHELLQQRMKGLPPRGPERSWLQTCTDKPREVLRQIEKIIPHLKELHFYGGEPLIQSEHYDLLRALIARKKTDVSLAYVSNFSTTVFDGIDVFELWSHFPWVNVSASLDGMERRGEYLRKNQEWPRIVENRKRMLKACPHVRFIWAPTLSLMNALHLPDFHRTWLDEGYVAPGDSRFSLLLKPEEYSVQALPAALKDAMAEKYERHAAWLRGAYGERGRKDAEHFIGGVSHARARDQAPLLGAFRKVTRALDEIRGERFEEAFPELAELMSPSAPMPRPAEVRDALGRTALGAAAGAGDAAAVAALLEQGSGIEARDKAGRTPLMLAVAGRKTPTAALLLDRGADLDARDDRGLTALMLAVINGFVDAMDVLLARGARVNARDNSGWTALMIAAERGRGRMVEALMKCGADMGMRDRQGRDALLVAAVNGRTSEVDLLLRRGAGASYRGGMKPLVLAAAKGYPETVRRFLGRQADEALCTDEDIRAAWDAAEANGRAEVCQILRGLEGSGYRRNQAGAQSNAEGSPGVGPAAGFLHAAETGDLSRIESFLDRGARIEARDDEGQTALLRAVACGRAEAASLLLDRGSSVDASDSRGRTGLILAAEAGRSAIAGLLLDRGARIEARNLRGQTALMRAADGDYPEVAGLLLARGADIEGRDESQRTPLMFAAEAGRVRMLDFLLERGADREARDDARCTALMFAALSGRQEAVRFLLERGAQASARDCRDETALMMAQAQGRDAAAEILRGWENRACA